MDKPILMTLSRLLSRTDEEAMWRVKTHGDEREFARLLKRWEEPIRHLCVRMTGDACRGEDLKQETFSKLFEKRKDYRPGGRFSTYLWRIALNLCRDDFRRRERRPEFLEGDEDHNLENHVDSATTPDFQTAVLEEGELVRQALLQLPEIYRTVLVLRHYEDLKLSRIAEILEIPEGTVNSRMAEALARLSGLLDPKFNPRRAPNPRPNPITRSNATAVL